MKRTRVVALDMHPDRVQGGFFDAPAPTIMIEPIIGYLKEMSPHLPLSHEIQLQGEERDDLASKIPLKEINPLVPPPRFNAISDFLEDVITCVLKVDPTIHPLFLSLHAPHLRAHGDKIAEIVFEGLYSPSFTMTWNDPTTEAPLMPRDGRGEGMRGETGLASWHHLASRAREALERDSFVPRSRYQQAGPGCLPFMNA